MSRPSHGSHVETAYAQIRDKIVSLSYPPGMPLRLKTLTELHGGSMIPIREALRRLEAERLVEVIPNRGARVAHVSIHGLNDAYSTRILLEVAALRNAATAMTPDRLDALRQLASRMNSMFTSGRTERGLEVHQQFHFALYEPSDSEWLLRLISVLWSHTDRYRQIATLHRPLREIAHEHSSIVEALVHKDTEGACNALAQHLQSTATATQQRYAELEADGRITSGVRFTSITGSHRPASRQSS